MRVQEKEKEKERARDEERKIKAMRKRTRCGQWRKSLENKNMMRLERSGSVEWRWGYVCGGEKAREKKKKKRKRKFGRKESKRNKKSQLNDTIIFSQYFTINFK